MSSRVILGATVPLLEQRLVADLGGPGLAPRWVVVPSATLANHVRLRLARAAVASTFANVRVVNLPVLAARLSAGLLHKTPGRWSSLHELLLAELVDGLPSRSTLAPLKSMAGGGDLLRLVFQNLGEGGFGLGQCQTLRDLAAEPDVARRERDALEAYDGWLALLAKRGVDWEPLVLQELAEAISAAEESILSSVLGCEPGQQPTLHVHGFYDFTDVNLEWLSALAGRVETRIYFPFHAKEGTSRPHAAFAFAEGVLSALMSRLGQVETETITDPVGTTGGYFLETFPEGRVTTQPEFISLQLASGIRAEAISAAIQIRQWLDDGKRALAPDEILVVAPNAEEYADTVQDVFEAFAIPVRFVDVTAGPRPESEPLRMLARILEDQAPAEWVLALLRATPGIRAASYVDVDLFERNVRKLGLWGGQSWGAALAQEEFSGSDEEGEHRHRVLFTAAERELIKRIAAFVGESSASWTVAEALARLKELQSDWLADPSPLNELVAAMEVMASQRPDLRLTRSQWTQLMRGAGEVSRQRDPMSRAVLFTPLMRARGVTAKALVFLGLSSGQMPFRVPEDPFLSEATSTKLARVARQIGHRLPLKSEVAHEMLLLFYLVNTSVERIHWVIPETDATGKAVAPTPWVQRYRAAWDREGAPKPGRLGRSPGEQAMYLWGCDPKLGTLLPPSMGAGLWRGKKSKVKPESLFPSVPVKVTEVSVTSLERLAKCPFHFYAEYVAEWEALEPLTLSHGLNVRAFGTLLHKLVEVAVNPYLRTQSLDKIAALMQAGNWKKLRDLAGRLPQLEPDAGFALAMLPPVFRAAAMREVLEMAMAYFAWAREDQVGVMPIEVEAKYKKAWPGLDGVEIVGRIDRVDEQDGKTLMVDFKSGKKPSDYGKKVKLGWLIQAVLYPWLCGKDDAAFRYIYLGGDQPKIGDGSDAPTAEAFLDTLAPIIRAGRYVPMSNQVLEELGLETLSPCSYCEFTSACRRFETGAAALYAEAFVHVAPERVNAMVAALAEKKKGKGEEEAS